MPDRVARASGRGTNPILGLVRTMALLLHGRLRFHAEDVDSVLETDDGRRYRVFRHVVIACHQSPPEALLIVRFTPAHMSIRANIRFSRLPLLVFPGFRGFRSKYWCVDDATGACEGVYEWQSRADAEAYADSIAMRFMTSRSLPGSVSWRILERVGDVGWPFVCEQGAQAVRRSA
jgi:hypothetical protein